MNHNIKDKEKSNIEIFANLMDLGKKNFNFFDAAIPNNQFDGSMKNISLSDTLALSMLNPDSNRFLNEMISAGPEHNRLFQEFMAAALSSTASSALVGQTNSTNS